MKKIRVGSIETLGYIGIIIWVAVIFLREYNLSDNSVYLFFLGILPNFKVYPLSRTKWVFISVQ